MYNGEHYHSALGLLTPAMVPYGQAERVRAQRQQVLAGAYAQHPERFVGGRPRPAVLPTAVWINAPKPENEKQATDERVVVVVEAVAPGVRPQRSEGLSPSPQPVGPVQRAVEDLVLLH